MAKKKSTKGKKKKIFEQVNLAFKNPVRTDILNELSQKPQRPKDLADNIGVQKQAINYHLNALKTGGLVKVQRQEFNTYGEISDNIGGKDLKGARINGLSPEGNIQVSYGVELTEDGRKIAESFVNRLYEDSEEESEENNKIEEKKNKRGIKMNGKMNLEEVTVFQNSAMFKMVGQFHCIAGENILEVDHLTNKMEKNSVRIKGSGSGKIVNILIENIFSDELIREKTKILTDKREELFKKRKELDDTLNDAQEFKQKTILAHKRFSEEFPKWFSKGKVDIASVNEMNSLFKEQISSSSKEIRNLSENMSEIQREIEKLNNEISQLGYDNQKQSESYFKVSVVLDAEKEADISIELLFMVYDAYWTPFYDIGIKGEDIEVNLMANVYNHTEIDWNNVNLNISTATNEPVTLEKPEPYHIDQQRKWSNRMARVPTTDLRSPAEDDGRLDTMAQMNIAFEETTVTGSTTEPEEPILGSVDSSMTSNFGVQTYNLKSKFSIVSDKNPKPVHLFRDKLPSIVQYFWTPTSPDRVLCNNKIRNKDRLILPGPAKVYVNDEYIGETQLDLIAPNQEFKLGERVTYDITIKKQMKAKQKQKEGTFKGKRAISYKFAIQIENLNDVKEQLILFERIPHSVSEKIKVKLGDFSDKYARNVMNVLKFVLNMSEIKGKKVIIYDYDVIYDKDITIYPPLP